MGSGLGRAWQRLTYWRRATVLPLAAAGPATGGAVDAVGIFFAGAVWGVLVQLQHWAGARRPWNLPPLLFGLAAAVSLGFGALLALVPDQDNLAMMGALLGPMITWFLVWLARWLSRRRAPGAPSPHPAIGGTLEA